VTIEQVIAKYGLPVGTTAEAGDFARAAERRLGRALPSGLLRFAAAPGLAHELAQAYTAQVRFPDQVEPVAADLGAGLRSEDLWLMTENQGVCVWAVPLDAGDDPPVLVAGDLRTAETARVYARSLDELTVAWAWAWAWAWDRTCLERQPLIQAQYSGVPGQVVRHRRSALVLERRYG
jgi:hypothetical protein